MHGVCEYVRRRTPIRLAMGMECRRAVGGQGRQRLPSCGDAYSLHGSLVRRGPVGERGAGSVVAGVDDMYSTLLTEAWKHASARGRRPRRRHHASSNCVTLCAACNAQRCHPAVERSSVAHNPWPRRSLIDAQSQKDTAIHVPWPLTSQMPCPVCIHSQSCCLARSLDEDEGRLHAVVDELAAHRTQEPRLHADDCWSRHCCMWRARAEPNRHA